jgi:hypothetical protein
MRRPLRLVPPTAGGRKNPGAPPVARECERPFPCTHTADDRRGRRRARFLRDEGVASHGLRQTPIGEEPGLFHDPTGRAPRAIPTTEWTFIRGTQLACHTIAALGAKRGRNDPHLTFRSAPRRPGAGSSKRITAGAAVRARATCIVTQGNLVRDASAAVTCNAKEFTAGAGARRRSLSRRVLPSPSTIYTCACARDPQRTSARSSTSSC